MKLSNLIVCFLFSCINIVIAQNETILSSILTDKIKSSVQDLIYNTSSLIDGNKKVISYIKNDRLIIVDTTKWKQIWSSKEIITGPIKAVDDKIYSFGQGNLFSFNISGKRLWKTASGFIQIDELIEENGILLALDKDNGVMALDSATGKMRWRLNGKNGLIQNVQYYPFWVYNNMVIVNNAVSGATLANYIQGFDITTGKLNWQLSDANYPIGFDNKEVYFYELNDLFNDSPNTAMISVVNNKQNIEHFEYKFVSIPENRVVDMGQAFLHGGYLWFLVRRRQNISLEAYPLRKNSDEALVKIDLTGKISYNSLVLLQYKDYLLLRSFDTLYWISFKEKQKIFQTKITGIDKGTLKVVGDHLITIRGNLFNIFKLPQSIN